MAAKYLEDGEPYIGLSPYKRQSRQAAVAWLDECFGRIEARGHLIKTHAFGVTSSIIMHRYPWASADSSRWALAAGYGGVPIPIYTDNQRDYSLQHHVISMTDRSHHIARHIDSLHDTAVDRVRRHLDRYGIALSEARYSSDHRHRIWLHYFAGLEESCRDRRGSPSLRHSSHRLRPTNWRGHVDDTRQGSAHIDRASAFEVRRSLMNRLGAAWVNRGALSELRAWTMPKMEKVERRYYTRRATATYRNESVSTVIRDEKAGRLKPIRFRPGGQVHYSAEQVEAPPTEA